MTRRSVEECRTCVGKGTPCDDDCPLAMAFPERDFSEDCDYPCEHCVAPDCNQCPHYVPFGLALAFTALVVAILGFIVAGYFIWIRP